MSDAANGSRGRAFGTLAVQGPEPEPGSGEAGAPHAPPLFQTTAFAFSEAAAAVAAFREGGEYIYSRLGNPTVRALERHVTCLETHPVERAPLRPDPSDVDSRFFASGMAAISAVALGVAAGGRILCQDGIYGTTVAHLERLGEYGIRVDFVPAGELAPLREAAEENPPALVYVESPANPLLQVTDLRAVAEVARSVGAVLAVDSTFATPALQRPLAWGADLSVHSTTKFMSGHGVALGGVVSGRRELIESAIHPARTYFGGAPDPFAAWITGLGLRTLAVRMERHALNAAALAASLAGHAKVERVLYPDPESLPDGQMATGGPMVAFVVSGGQEEALRVIDRLEIATLAPTLGTLDTLVQHPYTMSHGVLPEARRRALGIEPGLVRVSVGLEDPADILEAFHRAL
ncbi:MAG: trans-sulfuration enzyme family protein [Gemmatimonadota bacterium]